MKNITLRTCQGQKVKVRHIFLLWLSKLWFGNQWLWACVTSIWTELVCVLSQPLLLFMTTFWSLGGASFILWWSFERWIWVYHIIFGLAFSSWPTSQPVHEFSQPNRYIHKNYRLPICKWCLSPNKVCWESFSIFTQKIKMECKV